MTIKLKSTVDYLLIWDRVDLVRMVILILICSKMLENARNRSHDKDCINNRRLHRSGLRGVSDRPGVLSNTTQAWPNRETHTIESAFAYANNCLFAVPIPVLIGPFCAVLKCQCDFTIFFKSEIQYFKYCITQYRHSIKS